MTVPDFPFAKERVIIINCGTSMSATLSILSVLRYCDMPLLVIDCALPKDVGHADYTKLQELQKYCIEKQLGSFDLIQLPLRSHGDTLDYVFQNLKADYILLVDSDLEVLNSNYLANMRQWIQTDGCFGAGFYHGPYFGFANGAFPEGYYKERMWIPFCMLSVKHIREAIADGCSFNIQRVYNDFPWNQRLSGLVYKYTEHLHISMRWNPLRKVYGGGYKPSFALIDTGAEIYDYLYKKKYFYAGVKTQIYPMYCNHYDGCTRSVLSGDTTATQYTGVLKTIYDTLLEKYNYKYEQLNDIGNNTNI